MSTRCLEPYADKGQWGFFTTPMESQSDPPVLSQTVPQTVPQIVPQIVTPALSVPHHVAVIMDGNGRWARQHQLLRLAGHRAGVAALRACVRACVRHGVRVLTVFAFSAENWSRPQEEVSGLFRLFGTTLPLELPTLKKQGIRLHFVGKKDNLSPQILKRLIQAEKATQTGEKLILNVCFNYSGHWDITQAAQQLWQAGIEPTEEALQKHLALAHVPDPDLLVRTSGELRLSNFLLWQLAYTELFFSSKLWPDFDEADMAEALLAYAKRERRFGKTSAQV